MRTHVEFRSSAFPPEEGEEAKIDRGRWGMRLARFLGRKLQGEGIATGEPRSEDWGVSLPVKNERFPISIGCGNHDEFEEGFLCAIEPSRPTIRRWFREIPTEADVSRVAQALEKILRESSDISAARWWSEAEVDRKASKLKR